MDGFAVFHPHRSSLPKLTSGWHAVAVTVAAGDDLDVVGSAAFDAVVAAAAAVGDGGVFGNRAAGFRAVDAGRLAPWRYRNGSHCRLFGGWGRSNYCPRRWIFPSERS